MFIEFLVELYGPDPYWDKGFNSPQTLAEPSPGKGPKAVAVR